MKFILSTEDVNSYGIIIRTNGIDLSTFNNNPVMLFDHDSTRVMGKWNEVEKIDNKLMANAVFDQEDQDSKVIENKITQNFIKSCSIGIQPIDWYERADGILEISSCLLLEASVVALPANRSATKLKLYDSTGLAVENIENYIECSIKNKVKDMSKKDIKLKDSKKELETPVITDVVNPDDSKKELETPVIDDSKKDLELAELELAEKITKLFSINFDEKDNKQSKILLTLRDLQLQNISLSDKIKNLETELSEEKVKTSNEKFKMEIETALKEGRITNSQVENFNKLKDKDYDSTIKLLKSLVPKENILSTIQLSSENSEWTIREWEKKNPKGLFKMKTENPEEYKRLWNETYKK